MIHGMNAAFLCACVVGVQAGLATAQPRMVVTEWMYSGGSPTGGEFVEFTNIGDAPVDLAGWSFDDSGRQPGSFPLAGVIEPGACMILTEDAAADFRAAWGLGPEVVIVGGLGNPTGNNLGRNDEINLYDAAGQLVDRLTYGDEDFPGSVRTQRISGSPLTSVAVGTNTVANWGAAQIGDAQESWTSVHGDAGNPGRFQMPGGSPIPGPVTPSHSSGFYTGPISVSLESSEGVIRYTTDGSAPTTDSPVYTGVITVADRTPQPNYFSLIQSSPIEAWLPPTGNIFKATALRFAAFNGDGVSGPVTTRTYIIHPAGSARFTMPVISLVTDEPNLFDYHDGIYVPGAIYDKFYDPDISYWNREANYTQRGDEWERPARLEFFEPDGTPGPSLDVGLRIHGGATRANRRKSLRVYARSEYGQSWIEYPVFPGETTNLFKRLILRNGGNDNGRTNFRDAYIQDLVKDTGVGTQWQRPCIVLLNGEYWGIHNIRQRFDKYFLQVMYGADPDNIDLLSGPNSDPEEGDKIQFLETLTYIFNHDMSDPNHFAHVETLVDMDDYITYTAIQLFIANTDWPQNNIDHWRERVPGSRWRWLLYDTDLSFNATTEQSPVFDAVSRILSGSTARHARMMQSFMSNPDFRAAFLTRSADLMNKEFAQPNMSERLNSFQAAFTPEMAEHIHRWRAPVSVANWDTVQIERMRAFVGARHAHHLSHLVSAFDLPGTTSLTVNQPHPQRGSIRVNTIDLSGDAPSWTGVYFQTVPVTLAGDAAEGYRFVGFEEIPAVPAGDTIVWMPGGASQTLTARFVCAADFDENGTINFFDIAAYLAAFTAGDPAADLAAPFGEFNFFDLAAYIQLYNTGCP